MPPLASLASDHVQDNFLSRSGTLVAVCGTLQLRRHCRARNSPLPEEFTVESLHDTIVQEPAS